MTEEELKTRLCQLLFFRVPFYESVVNEILALTEQYYRDAGWKSGEEIQTMINMVRLGIEAEEPK